MSDQPQSSLFLVMRRGPQPNQPFPINKDVVTIGRAPDNDIVINDAGVSRYHANLIRSGEYWVIEDLKTPNGVMVNGMRIMEPVILTPGCQVSLGANVLLTMEGEVPLAGWQSAAQQPPAGMPAGKPRPRWPILAGLAGVTGLLILGGLALVAGGALAYFYWYLPSVQAPAPPQLVYPAAPQVTFLEPDSGLQVGVGESFLVFANARDEQGVARIDLWVDDQLVVQQDSPDPNGVTPFSLVQSMTAVTPGVHSLYARAYNKEGAMGESPALYVTVFDQAAAVAPVPETSFFIVQQGDTLQSIAGATNSSVPSIQAVNPGLGPVVQVGQVVAIPPHPPLPVPQAQPGQQPVHPPLPVPPAQPGQQPVHPPLPPGGQAGQPGMGAIIPNPPGMGAFIPNPPGQMGQILQPGGMGVFVNQPGPGGNAANPPNSPLKVPQGLAAQVDGCIVSLSWDPQGTNATGFAIYRRKLGNLNDPDLLKVIDGGTAKYTRDRVPYSGIYQYAVESVQQVDQGANKLKILNSARSGYIQVETKVSPNCIEDPKDVYYLYFQITNVTAKADFVALRYSVDDSVARRIPKAQNNYHMPGDWTMQPEIFPIPVSIYQNPSSLIMLKIWGSTDNFKKPPADLDLIVAPHSGLSFNNRDEVYKVNGTGYTVSYKLWTGGVAWNPNAVQANDPGLPAPTLRLAQTTTNSRRLQWDWNGDKNLLEDFVLYRSYSCPGEETEIRVPQTLKSHVKEYEVKFMTEPAGCAYRYFITAFSRVDESLPSNVVEGDTTSAYANAVITFTEIKFNNLSSTPVQAKIRLSANEHSRTTPTIWVKGGTFDLSQVELDGIFRNNVVGVSLAENEFLQLGFVVDQIDPDGFRVGAGICQGFSLQPPVKAWKDKLYSYTFRSLDGACELTIGLNGQPPVDLASGKLVKPQADIQLGPNIADLGNQFFAYIYNNGPDQPANNMILLKSEWQCADSKEKKFLLPWEGQTIDYIVNPYLELGVGQWVRIDTEEQSRLIGMRKSCLDILKREGQIDKNANYTNAELVKNIKLEMTVWIKDLRNIRDPNESNNETTAIPGPMQ